ncbi:hypothetical protein KP78_21340 [Jeotgalibacillus soli]|uniref:Transposase n=1 Tax=Jeotgalibacillus soli TaxID=889306 RepID=A0A0C2R6A1_9BACL|nr:hypothetical protein KP78_21340 [Jeotgalibacillus soli]
MIGKTLLGRLSENKVYIKRSSSYGCSKMFRSFVNEFI